MRLQLAGLVALVVLGAAVASAGWWDRATDLRGSAAAATPAAPAADAVARGADLARIGHCAGCHTARGGADFAGGRRIATPFGSVVAANLTPDAETGLGRWTPAAFRRALHEGRSADGRALLPVCPYPNFSLVAAADADDLLAYLQSLPPVRHAVPAHELRFPYGLPVALTAWRLLNFRPATLAEAPFTASASADAAVRRGAYLVGGLGHCSACHGQRDRWGATAGAWDFRGGVMPGEGWLAPSLADAQAAGMAGWSADEAVALLKNGRNMQATVSGPMALVVAGSLQHGRDADLQAMVAFLRQLPAPPAAPRNPAAAPDAAVLQLGEKVYERHCADCHGKAGEGVADAGPALAGNRALALASPVNVVRMVLAGGFGPSTAAEPRPLGMPPFATLLSDEEVAAVVTHMRWRHGRQAAGVNAFDVNGQR
ncbi:MAG: cytochrome c [Rubrivivax sp.]|nr:cytochrome c [Rubrivivax sp.]